MQTLLKILGYLTAIIAFFISIIIASYTLDDTHPLTQKDHHFLRVLVLYMGFFIFTSFILFVVKKKLKEEEQ